MNELNIIDFLFAKSYDSFEIIDENFSNVVINKNKNIIVPNDLILLTINSVAPYDQAISECVDLFAQNHNIALNENILSSPHTFGALLISNENNDLFKEWYSFKEYMLHENQISIDFDDRINILAQYLSLYNINEDIFIDQIKAYSWDYSTNIGTVNKLYSLCELFTDGFDKRLLDFSYDNDKSIQKELEQWGRDKYGKNVNIEVLIGSKTPLKRNEYYQVIVRSSDGEIISKQMFALDKKEMGYRNKDNNKGIKRLKKVDSMYNKELPTVWQKIGKGYENFMNKQFNKLHDWVANPNAKGKETLRKIGPKSKEFVKKINEKIKNTDWEKKKEDLRKIYNKGKESGKKIFKTAANDVKESFSAWNKARHTLGNSVLTGRRASHLR